ncbi:MAG: hypothetical protein GTN69_11910 [Armatimonadetes bacterium]|nr:hypothetical protein [Armatimonadota bacterium]NIO76558.1 hypothetical protein [Armatimonadota bacterium]NIO98919.1 hypothetical protein [Armatimonadota bacterium]
MPGKSKPPHSHDKTKAPKKDWGAEESLTLNYYMVAYIDFMGQKASLAELARTELDEISRGDLSRAFHEHMMKTYGAVEELRKLVMIFLTSVNAPTQSLDLVSRASRNAYEAAMKPAEVKLQPLSDALIIYVSLKQWSPSAAINGVYAALLASATMMPIFLASENPVRGGIDVHWASEISPSEVYGPALYNAYELESSFSLYPRITVGMGLIKYLKTLMYPNQGGFIDAYVREMADSCHALIARDSDSLLILDYLGKGYRNLVGSGENLGKKMLIEVLPKAFKYAECSMNRFRQEGNDKLAEYYDRLVAYYKSRADVWTPDGIDFGP